MYKQGCGEWAYKMKVWIDLTNPSDTFFFEALMRDFHPEHQMLFTVRDRSETVALANDLDIAPKVIGRDFSNRTLKTLNHAFRTIELFARVPKFDVALAFGGSMSVAVAKARIKPAVVFNDNDLIFVHRTFAGSMEARVMARADHIIIPSAFPTEVLTKGDAKEGSIHQFDGYKEDVYIADFKPAPDFLVSLPFKSFVVVRPEALFAAYVRETRSIVPELVKALVDNGLDVVYLPRIKKDMQYIEEMENSSHVFVPLKVLNGLDLCWHADAVLTGSGTFAREATCLGTTAVSFFPERLLSVDRQLVSKGKILHSRNIDEIMAYLLSKPKGNKSLDLERCRKVKQQVSQLVRGILEKIG
jgi:predicted glycosyltransferase